MEGFVSKGVRRSLAAKGFSFEPSEWRKGTDTMDVWFDSGSSWSLLQELGLRTEVGDSYYADVCLEGSDQHRGWFQSMLLTSSAVSASEETEIIKGSQCSNRAFLKPYARLITHGMVLDQDGKENEQEPGNVMSPLVIVNGGKVGGAWLVSKYTEADMVLQNKKTEPAYGADVLRFWAASVEYWRDMALGPTVLAQSAEALRKIRNSIRFAMGNINSLQYTEIDIDRTKPEYCTSFVRCIL